MRVLALNNVDVMNLLYVDEHVSCSHYLTDIKSGFSLKHIEEAVDIASERLTSNYIIFVLEGSVSIACNENTLQSMTKGEMILLSKSSHVYGKVDAKSKFIVFMFDHISHLCNKYSLQNLSAYTEQMTYTFKPFAIVPPILKFLDMLSDCLEDGLNCTYYHEIKSSEILLLYRAYYAKEELAAFFYPLVGNSIDFKTSVMTKYRDAKTVEELAMLLGYGLSNFKKKFKEEFDESAYQWMLKQKSKHIQYKLSFADVDFASIIDEFGFSSPAHFNRFCKTQYGKTPSELRKTLKCKIDTL
ncbi:MAG TPA: AraC family transcriptional regulator [Porphyromonadaceae bacterium]|nr:AraC family transcriptional regulator [Porphyromonadaceae bacterium]